MTFYANINGENRWSLLREKEKFYCDEINIKSGTLLRAKTHISECKIRPKDICMFIGIEKVILEPEEPEEKKDEKNVYQAHILFGEKKGKIHLSVLNEFFKKFDVVSTK